jgi:DNA topoisomerase-2
MSKDTNVDFTITFAKGRLEELETVKGDYGCNGIEKILKLYTTNTTTNMHLFNANDILYKYESVNEIIDDYFETRLELYGVRKEYMIQALERELILLKNKSRYIQENLNDKIDLRKKKKEQVILMLEEKGYDKIENDPEYKYLVKMPMDSVTEENVLKLLKETESKEKELECIRNTTTRKMWMQELESLTTLYLEYKENREKLLLECVQEKKKGVVKKGVVKKSVSKKSSSLLLESES